VWSGEDIQLIQLSDGELDTTQMKECGIVLANNYTISFRFCQLSEHGAGVRISFAIKDNENYMQLSLGDWNKSNNKLDQFINGKSSCLGQRNFHLEPRRMYRVKIDVHGAIAEIFVDDSFCYKVDAISQIAEPLYYSVQSNNNATEYIIKAANISDASKSFTLSIPTQKSMSGTIYSMGGYQLEAENTMEEPERIGIRTQEIFVDCGEIYYTMQEYSVCVIHVLQDC
jgi:alpha-L-arabinofuranosidase